MSKELSRYCRLQFEAFEQELSQTWGAPTRDLSGVDAILRGIHKRFLGIGTLASVVSWKSVRADYLRTLPEVSCLSIILLVKGLQNPSLVLLRQCIELVLKHIYFSSHPVEYGWSSTRVGFREIGFQFLLDYFKKTDEIRRLSEGPDLIQRIEDQFHILSRYVHVHSNSFNKFSAVGEGGKTDSLAFTAFADRSLETWSALSVLLIIFFPKRFLSASALEQRVIQTGLNSRCRKIVAEHLKFLSLC